MASKPRRIETRLRATFGLKCLPFAKEGDPEKVFATGLLETAQDRLRYLVDRRGIGVIFGAPGTGKSTLLRSFMASLGRTSHAVCYIAHTTCAVVDVYRQIARGLQLEPSYRKADVVAQLKERILKLSRHKKVRPVLIIDDAQHLPVGFLDEIRLLASFDADGIDDLTVILAGHPQLENTLRLAVNEALAQRVVIRVRLRSLRTDEVEAYLAFRLEAAGRTARLFLPDAVEAIAKASRGIPRLIDRVAEHCLLLALAADRKDIDAEIVTEAADEVDP